MTITSFLIRKWTGFICSLVCTMLCGITMSFNVYAVELKQKFNLTQTEVGLLGSSTLAGSVVNILGYMVIEKYSYRMCYIIAGLLVTSSGIAMWQSTLHVEFFKQWIPLMCLEQFINTAGSAFAELSCVAIGVTLFGHHRIGVVSGLYLAFASSGKIYYSILYQSFFKATGNLGGFFLTIPIGLTTASAICYYLHLPEESTYQTLGETKPDKSGDVNESVSTEDTDQKTDLRVKDILSSTLFHLILWPNAIFNGVTHSFMSDITIIAKSLEMKNPDMTVNVFCAGIILSRISFGAIFDFLGSRMAAICLLVFCYITFGISMVIGLFYLNEVTVYIMTAFASIGTGAGYSIAVGILIFIFGVKNFSFIISVYTIAVSLSSIVTQIAIGLLYDNMANKLKPPTLFCKECFYWAYVLLIGQSVVYLFLGLGTMCYIRKR